jgi:hypothetical protein
MVQSHPSIMDPRSKPADLVYDLHGPIAWIFLQKNNSQLLNVLIFLI